MFEEFSSTHTIGEGLASRSNAVSEKGNVHLGSLSFSLVPFYYCQPPTTKAAIPTGEMATIPCPR